jgi:hypothetical protein
MPSVVCPVREGEIMFYTFLFSALIRRIFSFFRICKSQHIIKVKPQHERCARKKDIKSVKEIHAHLNLQQPRSPIASEREESLKIESFEESIAHFDEETPIQQWYDDASFSGFVFLTMVA